MTSSSASSPAHSLRTAQLSQHWLFTRTHSSCTLPFVSIGVCLKSIIDRYSATASDSGELKLWDLKTKEALQTHKAHNGPVAFARFSPDGQWLITGAESSAKVWALAANAMLTELNCSTYLCRCFTQRILALSSLLEHCTKYVIIRFPHHLHRLPS